MQGEAMILNLGDLIGTAIDSCDWLEPIEPEIIGKCVVCGLDGKQGIKPKFSGNFNSGEFLQDGNVICCNCALLLKYQEFRRNSWIIKRGEIKFLKNDEILDALLDPPEPPFSIYLTIKKKRQGWFLLVNRINYSRDLFFVALETELMLIRRAKLRELLPMVSRLVDKGLRKSTLLTGHFEPWELKKLDPDVNEAIKIANQVRNLCGNPEWRISVQFYKKKRKKSSQEVLMDGNKR